MIRRALHAAALATIATAGLASAGPARADVIEIGAGGSVAVRASDHGGPVADAADPALELPDGALTTILAPSVPLAFQASLARAAHAAGVSPTLLAALVWQESRWQPLALSSKGALGLTQLMPATARALAVDPADATANLAGGARYLRAMLDRFNGDLERALAAYNAGPGRVSRAAGLPAIAGTRAYVSSIIDRLGTDGAPTARGTRR